VTLRKAAHLNKLSKELQVFGENYWVVEQLFVALVTEHSSLPLYTPWTGSKDALALRTPTVC
jgi:hypothetical protein